MSTATLFSKFQLSLPKALRGIARGANPEHYRDREDRL